MASAVLAFLAIIGPWISAASVDDWINVGGDLEHSSYKPHSLGKISGVELAWKYQHNGWDPIDQLFVLNGKLYSVTIFGSVNVIEPQTGKLISSHPIDPVQANSQYGHSAIDPIEKMLFVADIANRFLYGVNLKTEWPEVVWKRWVPSRDMIPCPALHRLFAVDFNTTFSSCNLTAYDLSTGEQIAKFQGPKDFTTIGLFSVYQDSRLLAITDNKALTEFDSQGDGAIRWNLELPGIGQSYYPPILGENLALVSGITKDGKILVTAVHLDSASWAWTTEPADPAALCDSYAVSLDKQYAYRSCEAAILKYDLNTGKLVYQTTPLTDGSNYMDKPIVLDDYIIAPMSQGVSIFDKATGNLIGKYVDMNVNFSGNWVYYNGLVFGALDDFTIYAFRPKA